MQAKFFQNAAEFRDWLSANHERATELWVGFHRKDSGRGGLTYDEALDEALCFGWIDGIRRKVNAISYTNRFTPRQPRSPWSLVNTRRAAALLTLGRMTPAGRRAFAARDPAKTTLYARDNPNLAFSPQAWREVRANRAAWTFLRAQPPGYQRRAQAWVMSAKRQETRQARLGRLLAESAVGRWVVAVTGKPGPSRAT